MVYERGQLLAETERFPEGTPPVRCRHRPRHAPAGAHADGHLRRQPAHLRRAHLGLPDRRVRTRSANGTSGSAQDRPFPVRPTTRTASPSTATRRTTSRSPGWSSVSGRSASRRSSSACRGGSTRRMPSSSRPRRWTGSGGRARTSSPSRCRDSRRPRTRRTTRSCHGGAGRHVGGARHPPGRDGDVAGDGPPFARGEEVYDVTFENVQAGMRTDYLFRIANQRGASSSAPATCPSWPSAGAPTVWGTRCRTTGSTPGSPRP